MRATGLVTAAALLGDTFLYTVLPVSAAKLGLDAVAVGLVLSVNRWARLVTNVLAARLYERLPAGALILGAIVLGAASTAAYAIPTALLLFLAARVAWGMAWSLLRLGTLLAAVEGAAGRVGRALGEVRAIYGLGYLGGALYAPFAVESLGWASAALLAAALTLVCGIGPALAVRGWSRPLPAEERAAEEAVRHAIVDPRFVGLFAVAAAQYGIFAGIVGVGGGLRIAELFGEHGAVVGIPVAATFVAGLFALAQRLSQLAWPSIAGRLADRSLGVAFVGASVVTVASSLGLGVVGDATSFVALGAAAFFSGITGIVALELAIAHRTTAADRPRILGAYATWADAGAAAGALGAGFLALGGTQAPLFAAAAIAAATLVAAPTVVARAAAVGASAP